MDLNEVMIQRAEILINTEGCRNIELWERDYKLMLLYRNSGIDKKIIEKEIKKEYAKKSYNTNKEKIKEAQAASYQTNKEIINQKQKIYRDNNKEKINKIKREKYQINKEVTNQLNKEMKKQFFA